MNPSEPAAQTFFSILFERPDDRHEVAAQPACFHDLNLDQIVAAITAGRDEYELAPFYHAPLQRPGAVAWRHEIFRDLENPELFDRVRSFAARMRAVRKHRTDGAKLFYELQKQAWLLESAELYCDAVEEFARALAESAISSRGLSAFRDHLSAYLASGTFVARRERMRALRAELATVKYSVVIKGDTVRVRKYEDEADYSAAVERTFEKFKRGAVKDYRVKFSSYPEMNHVEARILELVARLYPDVFGRVAAWCAGNGSFLDGTIAAFDREIQFYLAYLEYLPRLRQAGLAFCYPEVSAESKSVRGQDAFDLALASKLVAQGDAVVCNDFHLDGAERVLVVSGPNQGGKTTFARTLGQMHYLAGLGCPVPGTEARLFLPDAVFTHFEREENIETLRGKLEDDLFRIHEILERATPRSIVIMNEIFTSTTLRDALFLSREVMARIVGLGALCVWVTFIEEMASYGEQTVSMVSTVSPNDLAERTFKVVRRPADGLAYALAVAEKYRVTYEALKERIPS